MEDAPQNISTAATLTWQAPEYHHTHKSRDWFVGLGIVSVTIAIISILLGNILFAVFILLAAFTLAMFAQRPPRTITIELGNRGVLVEKTLYKYSELESFWIELEENEHHPKILFKSQKLLMPYIIVPLADMHPDEVGDFLAQFLPEVEHKEPLLQRLLEDLGF